MQLGCNDEEESSKVEYEISSNMSSSFTNSENLHKETVIEIQNFHNLDAKPFNHVKFHEVQDVSYIYSTRSNDEIDDFD